MQRERATHSVAGTDPDNSLYSGANHGPAWRPYEKHRAREGSPPGTAVRPHLPFTQSKAIRRQHILRELIDGGVNVMELPNGGYRLYGRCGDVILCTDLLNLLRSDVQRLCVTM
jgi:hypothetical protein